MDKPFGECSGRMGRTGKGTGGKGHWKINLKITQERDNNRPIENDVTRTHSERNYCETVPLIYIINISSNNH